MGGVISSILGMFSTTTPVKILLLGLAGSGKTSILHFLKFGEVTTRTVPTIGCNMETVTAGSLTFEAWDLGGQDAIRSYWRFFYSDTKAIVFVVDSVDAEQLPAAKDVLTQLIQDTELRVSAIAIFANKQDDAHALPVNEISEGLGLTTLKNQTWSIFKTSAITGEGLKEGLEWVARTLNATKK